MISNALIIFSTVIVGIILFIPKLANHIVWRATITPLASIIGSGFLILGPILNRAYGGYAPLVMLALCVVAFLFGAVIRANIKTHMQPQNDWVIVKLETLSSWVLAFAYIISVAYYLNLFGAFAVKLTAYSNPMNARILTSLVLTFILFVGWTRGFGALERLEQFSVGLKLSIIIGLIVGLVIFTTDKTMSDQLVFNPVHETGWPALTLAFGLIVTIQGFETSRYLGDEYIAETRIKSMRLAQYISAAIYIVYISLITYVFPSSEFSLSETAIIDMMEVVAPILPGLLIIAALSAQFSAAVADTGGSGGLITELTNGHIKTRYAYAFLVGIGLLLTWSVDIFDIVSYASRAFALYYGLQAIIGGLFAMRANREKKVIWGYWLMSLLGICIAIFGTAIEV